MHKFHMACILPPICNVSTKITSARSKIVSRINRFKNNLLHYAGLIHCKVSISGLLRNKVDVCKYASSEAFGRM